LAVIQNRYTFHKPVRKSFPRNTYTITDIDDAWEVDPTDLSSLSKYNKYKYLLNVMGIFSPFVWSVALTDKTATSITAALKSFFENIKPFSIQSQMYGICKYNGTTVSKTSGVILHTTHKRDLKGAIIERFDRTLKSKLFKYFTKNNTNRYLDVIDDILTLFIQR
jgi:hypothetical protein